MRPTAAIAKAAPVLLATLAMGCAGNHSLEAVTVLNYNQCRGLEPGLTRVDYEAVAGIRGGTLLRGPGNPPDQGDGLLLIAISRGQQPTPGYSFSLEGAHLENGSAIISVRWETPDSGAVLAQMLTHPCLVVGLPGNGMEHVEAVDQSGRTLGELDL